MGNPLFSSADCQQGFTNSRKDDLISWFYTLIFFIKGKVPWLVYNFLNVNK